MTTYAVTGATGFLGRAVVQALLRHDPQLQLRCLVRRGSEGALPPHAGRVAVVTSDLADTAALRACVAGCRAVIHLAGATHARDAATYEAVNVAGTSRLMAAAGAGGAAQFIFASTRAIGAACGAYGASKAAAEQVLAAGRIPATILRIAEVYGPGGTEGLNRLMRLVRRVPVVPVIRGARAVPLYLDDAVQAVVQAATRPAAESRTYTIAGPEAMTLEACVRVIANVLGVARLTVPVPVWSARPMVRAAAQCGLGGVVADQLDRLMCRKDEDAAAAMRELGVTPRRFADGVRACVGAL